MSNPSNPTSKRKPALEDAELEHCEPGDPCQREILIRADGTVWISALCGEILPVARSLLEKSS